MTTGRIAISLLLGAALLGLALFPQARAANGYLPVRVYDPKRDAEKDLRDALAEAGRSNRHVLIEVGGQWCSWCKVLDKYFVQHPSAAALRDKNYVVVAVNYSEENKNEAVLARFGKIDNFPHFLVLDTGGKLLRSQETKVLEQGKGYSRRRMREFLLKWAPHGR